MRTLRRELEKHRLAAALFLVFWLTTWVITAATWIWSETGETVGMSPPAVVLHLLLPLVAGGLMGWWRQRPAPALGRLGASVRGGLLAGVLVAEIDLAILAGGGSIILGAMGKLLPVPGGLLGNLYEVLEFAILLGLIGALAGSLGGLAGGLLAASKQARGDRLVDLGWRALAVGVIYALSSRAMDLGAGIILGPTPRTLGPTDPALDVAMTLVAGVVIGLTLGPLSRRLAVPTEQRAAVLFLPIFTIHTVVNVIEGLFFTDLPGDLASRGLATGAFTGLALAIGLAWLFRPPGVECGLKTALQEARGRRGALSWVWRVGLAGLLYLPTYFLFGMLAYPYVRAYYEDTAGGFVVPDPSVIFPLEVGRGLLFVLALLPLVVAWPGSRWSLALWLGLTIAGLGAWTPMLETTFMPPAMRLVHGLEITGDALVQGLTIAWLVGLKRRALPADRAGPRLSRRAQLS